MWLVLPRSSLWTSAPGVKKFIILVDPSLVIISILYMYRSTMPKSFLTLPTYPTDATFFWSSSSWENVDRLHSTGDSQKQMPT